MEISSQATPANTQEDLHDDHQLDATIKPPSAAAAAIGTSLPFASLSVSIPVQQIFLLPPLSKPSAVAGTLSPHHPVKIPSQISNIVHLPLSSGHKPSSSKISSSSSSCNTLHAPLPVAPRRHADPSFPVAGRRCSIVWFRADLRVHDNEALSSAHSDSLSVLPVYLFDPRDYGKSASGFDRTGPYRAAFLLDSVADLRRSLRDRGSDLVVRVGRPESVLPELARAVRADAVYAHREVSQDEVRAEERVEKAMQDEGVDVKYFWGSTLYHIEDLPFQVDQMPVNYGGFRERLQGLKVRKTMAALDQMKGLPLRSGIDPGEIPTLKDLGLTPPAIAQDGKLVSVSLVGGETEALDRLRRFAAECCSQPYKENKDGTGNNIYGANFSCKISPWLAMGCLSPRHMFDEMKKTATRIFSPATSKNGSGGCDNGMDWLMFELVWRDFFRFITKKYSSAKKAAEAAVPATACTPGLVYN